MFTSVKCDSCKGKAWKMHYNDPNLYITCVIFKVTQHISGFRSIDFKCRLYIYLHIW